MACGNCGLRAMAIRQGTHCFFSLDVVLPFLRLDKGSDRRRRASSYLQSGPGNSDRHKTLSG